MKKIIFLLIAVLFLGSPVIFAQNKEKLNKDLNEFRYDVEYVKTLADNMISIKVWTYHKKSKFDIDQCRKCAVHGVIFRGYAGGGSSQSALVKDPTAATQHKEFFDLFFKDGGGYAKYVTAIQNSSIETIKIGKEYKTGVIATIDVKSLRKNLETAGIIKSLNSGF